MGLLENKSLKRKQKADIQRVILNTVAGVGLLSVALLAPNAITALEKLGMLPGKTQKDSIRRTRIRLIEKGLLTYHGKMLRLTPAGKKHLQALSLRNYKVPIPKRWDKRWRVLIFDIPERKRELRKKIRSILTLTGFIRLQDSVWLYPYPCEELVILLKSELRLGKELVYMIVDTLEYDTPYLKFFKLLNN